MLTLRTLGLRERQSQRRLKPAVVSSLLPAVTHAVKRRYSRVCVGELMTEHSCLLRALGCFTVALSLVPVCNLRAVTASYCNIYLGLFVWLPKQVEIRAAK